jgi:uncharacterized protein YjiK
VSAEGKPLVDPAAPSPEELDKKERKRLKKLQKALEEAERPLDGWERYRALTDAFEMEQDLVDLADHKARFALLIMGTLNAVTFILGTRNEALALIPPELRGWFSAYIGFYALVALYYFVEAIESLRPRASKPNVPYPGQAGFEDYPMGVRFFEDVLKRDVVAYRAAWRGMHLGQLNAEVAIQVHVLARINKAKYQALTRLYAGLKGMTLLTAGLIAMIAFLAFFRNEPPSAADAGPADRKQQAGAETLSILGEATRFADIGVLEPSGVAFHAARGSLFVVGDEGSLVELSTEGKLIGSKRGYGNLEDVAVHTPSGSVILLAEMESQLVLHDAAGAKPPRKWALDRRALLGTDPGDRNQGFEGLAFREDRSKRGGGIFYLAHQRGPTMLVAIAFDPEKDQGPLGGEFLISRHAVQAKDLTALAYVPALDRLLALEDTRDRVLVLGTDGRKQAEFAVPGIQQEGLSLDAAGNLWIADDRGGLLRFEGALAALRESLRAQRP